MSKFGLSQLTTSSRMKDIFSLVQGGVNNMMNSPAKELPVTKLVKNIMDTKVTADTERYLYFDPKVCYFILNELNRKNQLKNINISFPDSSWTIWANSTQNYTI